MVCPERRRPFLFWVLFQEQYMDITITVNGKAVTIKENSRISDFLTLKKLSPDRVVVEYNLDIIDKDSLGDTILKENDTLEILQIVGGG
jgi:sulfur carrier protein